MDTSRSKSTKRKIDQSTFGGAQFTKLLNAIESDTIYNSQSSNAKKVEKEEVVSFLKEKLAKHRHTQVETADTFDYLYNQSIDSDQACIEKGIALLKKRYLPCIRTEFLHQLKIPTSSVDPSPSDKRVGKKYGLIQIQTYNLAILLDQNDCNYDTLVAGLGNTPSTFSVGAHLCKSKCTQVGHTAVLGASINVKLHDGCPAFWMVNGTLINMCNCDPIHPCIVPGPLFNANLYKLKFAAIKDAYK